MHVQTTQTLYAPGGLRLQGHLGVKGVIICPRLGIFAVIFLQIGTCESQDSLALKIMSPVVNLWVPYQITYYSVRITNDDIKRVG